MRTLSELQKLVGEWSQDNFGDQVSKTSTFPWTAAYGDGERQVPLHLGSLAPLLGIGEEIGEFWEALSKKACGDHSDENQAAGMDAMADIVIYVCDFATREGITLRDSEVVPKLTPFPLAYGRLLHIVLKRHQGIRGYENREKYETERDAAIYEILGSVAFNCGTYGTTPSRWLEIANETFDKIVAKRNWKSRPKDAADVPPVREKLSIDEAYAEKDREAAAILRSMVRDLSEKNARRLEAEILSGCFACKTPLVENGKPIQGSTIIQKSFSLEPAHAYCGDCSSKLSIDEVEIGGLSKKQRDAEDEPV